MKSITATILFTLIGHFAMAQYGIGTIAPSPSSILDIQHTTKGLLLPRVSLTSTTDVVTIANPATSLLVYNINTANDVTPGFYYWEGSWKTLKGASGTSTTSGGWGLSGNTLASGSEYIGTNNYNPLLFRVNNNPFARFHPLGGIAIGNSAAANNNLSIAIGTSANASSQNEAIAIGKSATASGFQSTAIGTSSTASATYSIAMGLNSNVSAESATAIGVSATSSGQFATAIGYQATATQANSIILGKASEPNNKVGIGTSTPDERLHVVGAVKIVDGTQGAGKVLTSDANGKGSWVSPSVVKAYGDIYYNGTGQTLSQYSSVNFGSTNSSSNVTVQNNYIQITKAGKYRITYRITLAKSTGNAQAVTYNIYSDYNTIIPGSLSAGAVDPNRPLTLAGSVIADLSLNQQIQVRSLQTNADVSFVANGCSLSVELVD